MQLINFYSFEFQLGMCLFLRLYLILLSVMVISTLIYAYPFTDVIAGILCVFASPVVSSTGPCSF